MKVENKFIKPVQKVQLHGLINYFHFLKYMEDMYENNKSVSSKFNFVCSGKIGSTT